jgi:PST family polysaccharide transporter
MGLGISLLNASAHIAGVALVLRGGIVAVAAAYVVCGYLLSPIALWAVRSLIQIDLETYFRQYVTPLAGSFAMALVVSGTKYVLSKELEPVIRLVVCTLAGMLAYLSVIWLIEPALFRRVLGFVRLVLPGSKSDGSVAHRAADRSL